MSAYDRHLRSVLDEAKTYPDRAVELRAYVAKCREAERYGGRFRLGTSRTLHKNPRCVGRAGITIEPILAADVGQHFVCGRCGS